MFQLIHFCEECGKVKRSWTGSDYRFRTMCITDGCQNQGKWTFDFKYPVEMRISIDPIKETS